MEYKQSFLFRWNRFAILLSVFISGVTPYLQRSHVCSPRQSSTESCLWFNTAISCDDTERILIRDAIFGFRYTNLCEYTANSCMKSNDCCSPRSNDYTLEYSPEQKYGIYKECSWSQKCTKRLQAEHNGKLLSLYSVIKYECVKENQVIHFCQESSVTGKSINIIFDGNHRPIIHNPAECTCVLVTHNTQVQYTINAPDLRLMSENGNCNSEAILSGLGNVNISCTAKFENRTSSRVMLGERQFRLEFNSRPEFVWMRAEIQGSISSPVAQIGDLNQVTVKCYKPIQQAPSTTQASSTAPYSSTTKMAGTSRTSSDFPILAVVIPIVLVISGLAVLLIFIIKCRCKSGDKKINKEKDAANSFNAIETVEKIKYENLFSPESAVRTNDNYVILEPENVYSSIRSDDVYPIQTVTGLVKANKPYPDSKVDNGYTNLNLDSEDHETDKIEEDMNSVINDLEQVVMDEEDKHDYLVLDPQSLYQDSDTAGLSDSDSRNKPSNDTYEKTLREMSD